MEIKIMDQRGIDFLIQEEGLELKPYKDTAGIPTIGIGNTYYEDGRRVQMTDPPITRDRAMRLMRIVKAPYEKTVWSMTRDDLTQNMFNALVSLAYNIGITNFRKSTLLRRVNANLNDRDGITDAFLMWRYSEGEPILFGRRTREVVFFFS